jgi:hypothetical protein
MRGCLVIENGIGGTDSLRLAGSHGRANIAAGAAPQQTASTATRYVAAPSGCGLLASLPELGLLPALFALIKMPA